MRIQYDPDKNYIPQSWYIVLLKVAGIYACCIVFLLAVSNLVAVVVAPMVSFELEKDYGSKNIKELYKYLNIKDISQLSGEELLIQKKLELVKDKIINVMDLPPEMTIEIRYSPMKTFNAFAHIGGYVVVFKGLIDTIENEDTLAMVIAHEIAHIKHRDGTNKLVRYMLNSMALRQLGGYISSQSVGLSNAKYSRRREKLADRAAAIAVTNVYGHAAGAVKLMEIFIDFESNLPDRYRVSDSMFLTHPPTPKRLEYIQELANYDYPLEGKLTPLFKYAKKFRHLEFQ